MQTDPFEILGLPPSFELSDAAIEAAFLGLATEMHPDIAAGDEEAARRMAVVNDARRALLNPEVRAGVLLDRLGGPPAGADKGLPDGFLADVMSLREEIDEQLAGAAGEERRATWIAWSRSQRSRMVDEVTGLFRSVPKDAASRPAALRAIRVKLNAWRYIERLIEQLDPGYDAKAGL